MRRRLVTLAVLALLPAAAAAAGPLSADEVAARAAAVDGGSDGRARVSFVITEPGRKEVRQDFAMLWKRYPRGPVAYKVLFFPEFPPDRKGYNWLGFLARPGQGEDAAWMYLPDLHTTRRIHGPEAEAEDDPFHRSLLGGPELIPRTDPSDTHRLLGEDTLDGRPVYRLETTHAAKDYPYSKTVRWIDRERFLTLRAEHYTSAGRRARVIDFTWVRAGKGWVWKEVEAADPDKGTHTRLTVSEQRVDLGLPDRRFSEATLRAGPERFF